MYAVLQYDYLCELLLLWLNIALHFTDCYSCTLRPSLIINFSLSCSRSFMNSFPLFIYKLTSCYLISLRGVSAEERRSEHDNKNNNNDEDDGGGGGGNDEWVTLSKNAAKNERQEKRAQFRFTGEDEWNLQEADESFSFLRTAEDEWCALMCLHNECMAKCKCVFVCTVFWGIACLSCVQKAFLRWNCNCSTYLLTAKVKYLLFFAVVVIFLAPFFPI